MRMSEKRVSDGPTDAPCLVASGFQPAGDFEYGGWRLQE
jgi:hypothetical protein